MSRRSAARFQIDLHLHSTCSDGELSPEDLVARAAARGVRTLALTDHDTTEGCERAQQAAQRHQITVIPGIEISAWIGREVHILGHFVDPTNPTLRDVTATQKQARILRVGEIAQKLSAFNIDLDTEAVIASADGNVGRPHVARALVKSGHAKSFNDAFRRYLGNGKPCYVPASRLEAQHAIALIHGAGGTAAIAHPGPDDIKPAQLQALADAGLDAVECRHPAHNQGVISQLQRRAREMNLVTIGGSDFHHTRGHLEPGDFGTTAVEFATLAERARSHRPTLEAAR